MAEPATDVGCESTFTMLYIATLESKSKDHWDECCLTFDRADVSELALDLIPPKDRGKVMVRMTNRLLDDWFEVCKVIAETVASIDTSLRKDVFPVLLEKLGFGDPDNLDLCVRVDSFYTHLFNLRRRGKYIGLLSPCLRCPSESRVHQHIVHMFNGLQVLHCVYEKQQSLEAAQLEQASSSGGVDSGGCAPEAAHGAAAAAAEGAAAADVEYHKWLDPERLCEDVLLNVLPDRTWTKVKDPSLCSWRGCFGVIADSSVGAQLKQKAVTSMAIELARFVTLDIGMVSQDLQNINTWVLAEQGAGAALILRCIDNQRLKVEMPRHLKGRGCVTAPADPRNIMDKVQKAARDERSRTTRQGMERLGGAVMDVNELAMNVRSGSAPSSSNAFIGESATIPPQCVGRLPEASERAGSEAIRCSER